MLVSRLGNTPVDLPTVADVLDSRFLHTDADRVSKLAQDYARANEQIIATPLPVAGQADPGRPSDLDRTLF